MCPYLAAVKCVPATASFFVYLTQIGGECCRRIGKGLEAEQLWMMAIAFGVSLQDLLRQQCLAPQRD